MFLRCPFKTSLRAFTLVELLAVIAIVLILATLIVIGVNAFMVRAQGAACASNMRQVGMALLTYRTDHNGWFTPESKPIGLNQGINFNTMLVPDYLRELPICPSATKILSPAEKQTYGTVKRYFQQDGGTYAMNQILGQWKLEAMPPPEPGIGRGTWSVYKASETLLLTEIYRCGKNSLTWTLSHASWTLSGFAGVPGRNHGGKHKDALNFMFVDGHVELISQNDTRNIPAADKSWQYPGNPNGMFSSSPQRDTKYMTPCNFNTAEFNQIYGQ